MVNYRVRLVLRFLFLSFCSSDSELGIHFFNLFLDGLGPIEDRIMQGD